MKSIKLSIVLLLVLILFTHLQANQVVQASNDEKDHYLYPVKQGGKWGFMNKNGEIIIDFKYDGVGFVFFIEGFTGMQGDYGFSEGYSAVKVEDKWGYINTQDEFLFEPEFDRADSFKNGITSVAWGKNWDKVAYINTKGKKITKYYYEETYNNDTLTEGYALVNRNNKYGFIDETGKEVIPMRSGQVLHIFSEGLAVVERYDNNGGSVYIDKKGKIALKGPYKHKGSFSEGLAPVGLGWNGPYGYINKTGKLSIPIKFDNAKEFQEGLAPISKQGHWGFIDKTGKVVIKTIYDWVGDFNNGFVPVEYNGKAGMINKSGDYVIKPAYCKVDYYHDGLAIFNQGGTDGGNGNCTGGKWGAIDEKGKIVIPAQYDYLEPFYKGLARAYTYRDDGKRFTTAGFKYIDLKGKTIWEPKEIFVKINGEAYEAYSPNFLTIDGQVHVKAIDFFEKASRYTAYSEDMKSTYYPFDSGTMIIQENNELILYKDREETNVTSDTKIIGKEMYISLDRMRAHFPNELLWDPNNWVIDIIRIEP